MDLPEFYGTVKKINHMDITIEQLYFDKLQTFLERVDKQLVERKKWRKKYGRITPRAREGWKIPPMPELPDPKKIEVSGPKVTLSCINSRLIDKAIESTGRVCKFIVEDGKIKAIETITEEKVRAGPNMQRVHQGEDYSTQ